VLRGMEFYRGRLIAYSLGNFAGGGNTLRGDGILKYGGILKVSLTTDGSWVSGEFLSTAMNSSGRPTMDSGNNGRKQVDKLSRSDFGDTRAAISSDGVITPAA
jgi:poly-gamma-glutamate capsule biosynthesis protein CapA/YwtB (metallophosphatase superfamily)